MAEKKILKKRTLHFVEALSGEGKKTGVQELELEQIDLENTRFEYRIDLDIELLMESIQKDGQQIPVIVRGTSPPYQLICGFRRVRSIRALGERKVKAIIIPELSDEQAHRLSVLENEERKSLTDLDRANACKRLKKEGKKQEEIAVIMGCSQSKVSKYLSLLKLPGPIMDMLKAEEISTKHALILKDAKSLFPGEYFIKLLAEVSTKQLSTRELERKISAVKNRNKPKPERVLFKKTASGFRLSGITYKSWMNDGEKEKLIKALKEALSLLEGVDV